MPLDEQTGIWYADHRDPTVHRPPVLLIHGAGGTHLDWPAELRRLPEANAIAPDLPGHGRSTGSVFNTVGAYAAALIDLLDSLKLTQVIALGFSMGGAVAQVMALHHPSRVAGVILLATSAKMHVDPTITDGLQSDYNTTLQTLIDKQWAEDAGEQVKRLSLRRLQEIDPAALRGDYQAVHGFDVRDRVAQINVPTLILSGTADRITPPADSDDLNEQIANSRLVKIDGGGHLVALEQPQAVADAVQAWLMEVFP